MDSDSSNGQQSSEQVSRAIMVLVALHVVANLAIWWANPDRPGRRWLIPVAVGLWVSDACLLAAWWGLGRGRTSRRTMQALAATAALMLICFATVGGYKSSESLVDIFVFVAWPALMVLAAVAAARRMGYSVMRTNTIAEAHRSPVLRFSIIGLMVLTTVAAVLLTSFQVVMQVTHAASHERWLVLRFALSATTLGLLQIATVFARGPIWQRLLAIAASVIIVAGSIALDDRHTDLGIAFAIEAGIMIASLLVIRVSGYRLVVEDGSHNQGRV